MIATQVAYSDEQYPARHEYYCILCGCKRRFYTPERPRERVICPGCKSEMVINHSTQPVDTRVPIDNRYRAKPNDEDQQPNR
jgi:hypothetical protein